MTREEIFTEFVKHLSAQNTRSSESANPQDGCVYRMEMNGKTYKCAAGFFIPDNVYDPGIEGIAIDQIIDGDYGLTNQASSLPGWMREHKEFLTDLQDFHDSRLPGSIYEHWTPFQRKHVQKLLLDFADWRNLPTQAVFDNFPVNPPT